MSNNEEKGQIRITKEKVQATLIPRRGFRNPGRAHSSCTISDTRLVTLVKDPVISHERGKKKMIVTTT
jgi:hypothetical protein